MVVAYQNRIVMERTLDQALARLFGEADRTAPVATSAPAGGTPAGAAPAPAWGSAATAFQQMAAEARDTYQRALDAQRAGDWAKYGEEIKRLGELLERMRQR